MHRISLLATCLVVAGLTLLSTNTGCSKKDDKAPPPTTKKEGEAGTKEDGKKDSGTKTAAAALKPGNGKIIGKIVYDGKPPECATLPAVEAAKGCKAPSDQQFQNCSQQWIVGKEGGVANVVIYLKGKFELTDELKKPKDEFVVIDQPHCAFIPHVVAVKAGQQLKIKNSADFNHNSKLDWDKLTQGKDPPDYLLKPKGEEKVALKPQTKPISVSCNVHGWMQAKIWVFSHPYAAVTKDDGSFEIDNVPTGAEIHVVGWHEGTSPEYFLDKKETIKEGGTLDLKTIKIK